MNDMIYLITLIFFKGFAISRMPSMTELVRKILGNGARSIIAVILHGLSLSLSLLNSIMSHYASLTTMRQRVTISGNSGDNRRLQKRLRLLRRRAQRTRKELTFKTIAEETFVIRGLSLFVEIASLAQNRNKAGRKALTLLIFERVNFFPPSSN